jgi:hypothetical protein
MASLDDDGILDLYVHKGPSTPSGRNMFDEAMAAFGSNVRGVRGTWLGVGDMHSNFDAFYQNLREGMSAEEAAVNTFTGRNAVRHGFTEVEVISYNETRVQVVFR